MNVIITGGCGFVGSNLALAFRREGWEVSCLDNLSRRGSEVWLGRLQEQGVTFVHGDVRQPDDLRKLHGTYHLLVEASAEPSVLVGTQGADARYLLDVNLQGAINCFEWARERQVPVLFLSTSRVYPYDRLNACRFRETGTRFELTEGCPGVSPRGVSTAMPLGGVRSLYGATKLCAEIILQEYAAQYQLPALINRCGVIAGPWQLGKADQGVFTYWLAQHYFNRPLKYIGYGGQGKQMRDLLHVDDLCDLLLRQAAALTGPARFFGDVFNVGGGPQCSLSLCEATTLCTELTGRHLTIGHEPANRPADVIWYVTDNGNTGEVFQWHPQRDARQILADTHRWLQEQEPLVRRIFT